MTRAAVKSAAYPTDRLTLLPVGGLGVIGMNNMLLSCGDDTLLLDSGITFPGPDQPGVNLVLPALDVIGTRADTLRAIVLTHGHEDHIGAVPFVLARHNVPVYGTRFTLELVRQKLVEHGLAGSVTMHEVAPGDHIEIGCFRIGFLRVTHSIPDCVSLRIETPVGRVLFTGDWKIDDGLPDGTRMDEAGFRKFGDDGVLLMMSDSTNAETDGATRSEGVIAKKLEEVIAERKGRVLVGLFSSNLYRVRAVVEAARKAGRYTALLGRSLHRYTQVADLTTRLDIRPSDLIDARDIDLYDDHELVLICTGSQGEVRASLRRIASGRHQQVRVHEGDTLLMSARRIPGNERGIYEMLDDFTRQGVDIVHPGMIPELHASGHARRDELRAMLKWVRPRFFLPVHGTHAFMQRHAGIAREEGAEQVLVIENGQVLEVDGDGMRVVGELDCTPWLADGKKQGSAQSLDIRGRVELMNEGVVAISVHTRGWSKDAGKPKGGKADGRKAERLVDVGVKTCGLAADDRMRDVLVGELQEWIAKQGRDGTADWLSEEVRRRARRFFKRTLGKRPVALVVVDGQA